MKRSHQAAPTNLRKSRITNKARLRIHRGNLDSTDPFLLDPDQVPQAQTRNYGIDSEDANEHHLQQVLSAAAELAQTTSTSRPSRSAAASSTAPAEPEKPSVFIPTPDSTGIVADFEKLYHPISTWVDPVTYIKSSQTVEQAITGALADEFTYYMDERDKEWLDKNNAEAKGEGTSTQGAIAANSTRNSVSRNAKSKGKEPEASSPVVISEDNFELVMGLFEKVTHEKTEYLHHSLETGMSFPAFTDYQDTFANPLTPACFASYIVPKSLPEPAQLVRMAKAIYPHWRERRVERGGHRVIPTLNGNEADTLNESYICFRRREIKAVRKTRASQVTSNDKLVRLNSELALVCELATATMKREVVKKDLAVNAAAVWEKRVVLADLKRKFPSLGDKSDEELLIDRERLPSKRSKLGSSLKVRGNESATVIAPETTIIRPRERFGLIQANIERDVAKMKDRDNHWDDTIDAAYQPLPVPFAARAFKYISSTATQGPRGSSSLESPPVRQPMAVRLRHGRGGRIMVDRRDSAVRSFSSSHRRTLHVPESSGPADSDIEMAERNERLVERWRFDADDVPAVGPEGSDELDRMLLDDYDTLHLAHMANGFKDSDIALTKTDALLHIVGSDGRIQPVLPYRLGPPNPQYANRNREQPVRPHNATPSADSPTSAQQAPVTAVPVSQQTQMKKMPPPSAPRPQVNGAMRPPAVPASASMPPPSAPASQPVQHQTNGTKPDADLSNGHTNNHVNNTPSPSIPNGVIHLTPHQNRMDHNVSPPARPPSQNQQHQQVQQQNGYRYPQYVHHSLNSPGGPALNATQMQHLKSAFATANNVPQAQDITNQATAIRPPYNINGNSPAFMGNAGNMQLKLPPSRNWANSAQTNQQRPLPNNMTISNGSPPNASYGMVNGGGIALRASRTRVHEAEG